jgi:hypothetical protein
LTPVGTLIASLSADIDLLFIQTTAGELLWVDLDDLATNETWTDLNVSASSETWTDLTR